MPAQTYNLQIVIDAKNNASPKLQAVQKDMGGMSKAAGVANQALGAAGLTLSVAGLVTVAGAAGSAMVKLAMDAEQTKVAFTTLIGSAAGAQQHLEELRTFAASTPFQFNDLTEASKKMQAFGFESERIVPMLTNIGDAVAAMGGGSAQIERVTLALGQMQAKGKVSAGEMLQLTEAGIPAWKYLADAIGVSTGEVMKMSEKGLIPAGDAINYILAGMDKDFGGMMAAQSQTAAGKLSNLIDKLEAVGTKLGTQVLPEVITFIEYLSRAGDAIDVLIGWEDGITGALDAHEQQLLSTTTTYDAYIQGMVEAEVAAGRLTEDEAKRITGLSALKEEVGFLTQAQIDAAIASGEMTVSEAGALMVRQESIAGTEVMIERLGLLTDEQFRNAQINETLGDTRREAIEEFRDMSLAVDDNTQSVVDNAAALASLQAGLSGKLTSATDTYTESQADLSTQIAETQAELDKYLALNGQTVTVTTEATASQAEYDLAMQRSAEAQAKAAEATANGADNALELTVAAEKAAEKVNNLAGELGGSEQVTLNYATKIGEAQAKLGELTAAEAAAKAELRSTTNEFLYQQLAVEGDDKANLALARSLGILDEQSYAAAEAARLLKEQYEDGTLSADGYATKSGLLADAIARLQDKKITITVDAITNEIRNIVNAASNAAMEEIRNDNSNISGQATGGPFVAGGAYMFNESSATRPEVIVAGQNGGGYVLTKQDAQAALAGAYGRGGNTYNVTINDQLAAKLFLEEVRRRELADVNGKM